MRRDGYYGSVKIWRKFFARINHRVQPPSCPPALLKQPLDEAKVLLRKPAAARGSEACWEVMCSRSR